MTPEKKKIGRPRKHSEEAARPTLSFRLRGSLHQRVQADAKERSIPMSEVVERNLERFYEAEEYYSRLDGVVARAVESAVSSTLNNDVFSIVSGSPAEREAALFRAILKYRFDNAEAGSPPDTNATRETIAKKLHSLLQDGDVA